MSAPFDSAFFSTAVSIIPFEFMPGVLMGFKQNGRFVSYSDLYPECTEGTYTILSSGKIKATVINQYSENIKFETVYTLSKAGNLIFGSARTTVSGVLNSFGIIVGRHTETADLKMDEILADCAQ